MRTPDLSYGIHPSIDSNTLAMWPLDEGTGTVAADIVNGRDVNRGGGVTWENALIGKAANINTMGAGMEDTTTAAGTDASALQGEWSCEVWVNVSAATAGDIIQYSNKSGSAAADNIQLTISQNANLTFLVGWQNAGVFSQSSTAKLRVGVWQHIAVTKQNFSGTFQVKTYLNGKLDNTVSTVAPPTSGSAAKWYLGTGKTGHFRGSICSAHVTTTVMTQSQIRESWRRGMLWRDPASTGHGLTDISCSITPTWSGSPIDVTNLLGYNFVKSVTIRDSINDQVASATIQLFRSVYENSLAPLMQASPINQNPPIAITHPGPTAFASFLGLNAGVTIGAARRAASSDHSAAYTTMFQGTVDTINWGSEIITLACRDSGKALKDTYMEEVTVYGDASMESTMQSIITTNVAGPPTLYTPTSPSFTIRKYEQRREAVLDALTTIADLTGWLVKYRYDPQTDTYRLTLYDPERTRVRVDGIINADDYTNFSRVYTDMGNVRNAVRIVFPDSNQAAIGEDEHGNPIYPMKDVTRTDGTSIAAYGRRFMEISESGTSQIDTLSEAEAMADAIIDDLADGEVFINGVLGFWELELGDKLIAEGDGTHFDTDQELAIIGLEHRFEDSRSYTNIQAKAKPASGTTKHLVKGSGPGRCLPPTTDSSTATVDFGVRGLFAPARNLANIAELLKTSPTLAGAGNPGFLVHPDGESLPPLGWDPGSGVWGSGNDVYFTISGQNSGDRALELRTVGANVTSQYMPVMGGRTYSVRVQWNGTVAGDKLKCELKQYDGSRSLLSTTTLFHEVVTAHGTYQVNNGIITTAATARWAQVVLTKTVGGSIYIDRVQINPFADQFSAQYSSPAAVSAGTVDFKPDSENFDYGGLYNNGTGDYTANEPGIHQFQAQIELTATSTNALTGASASLRVGGVFKYGFTFAPPSGRTTAIIPLLTPRFVLAAGDVVDIQVTIPTNCAISGWFQGGRSVLSDP